MTGARLPTYESRSRVSGREREVWALLAAGKTNAQIAAAAFIAEQTVKFHLTNLYSRLGVTNRTEAALAWWKANQETWSCCGREVYTPFCPWCGSARP